MEIRLPKLTTYQKEVYEWFGDCYKTGKVAVIKSVRQSGKSFFCMIELIIMATQHPSTTSIVIEPTLEQCRNIFKNICKALDATGLIKNANAQTLNLELSNGSQILFRSTQQGDSALRGYTCSGILVLDECAYLSNDEIYTLLPLLNANNAPLLICSTPFTMEGYFYDMWMLGLDGSNSNVKSFDWAKEDEISRFLTDERKQFYKATMSPQKYTTEVMGDFLTNDGLLFKNIENCVINTPSQTTYIYIGIDFATGNDGDYTVMTVLNQNAEMVEQYRTNNLTPMQQVEWLYSLIEQLSHLYTIRKIVGEKNSIGAVYIDALNQRLSKIRTQITDFVTTNKSKQYLVTSLQIAFENEMIKILNKPILLNELRRYEAEININTKVIRYNGKGANDDCVMSLMFAYYAYKNNFGNYSISFL